MEDQVTDRAASRAASRARPASGTGPAVSTASPAARRERLPWIFRHALRQGHVHPLMEHVRRYREDPGAGGAAS